MNNEESKNEVISRDFIRTIIDEDLKEGKNSGKVHTRFPPEPNGYLHIGHAKSILLNYGISQEYGGKFNLRFDDTNPEKEETEYVDSIMEDVKWLGVDWEDRLFFASDYFDQLYAWAINLIEKGLAYVCDLNPAEMREYRGIPTEPGKLSPFRSRSVKENLELFEKMKNGEFPDGAKTLRAMIDMTSPNMNLRDPALYRIKRAHHHRTGDKWCIYPMYDFAHGQSDSIECITHSICTLEFENHRPLYNWFIEHIDNMPSKPRQIEFARLNLDYTVMSKRKLLQLVQENHVNGWDDPRMPTISGLRRRGYTSLSLKNFVEKTGVAKRNGITEVTLLEDSIRKDLNSHAQRVMGVVNPVKVIITNYPEDLVEELEAVNNPEDETMGKRKVPFSKELYIEKEDFQEVPHKKFHRLSPGKEVRLRYAYIVMCTGLVKDDNGEIAEIHCEYDPETKSGLSNSGKKVKGTIHWVSAKHAIDAEVRLYDRLFIDSDPSGNKEKELSELLNPKSLEVLENCKLEPFLKNAKSGDKFQFERRGYFNVDLDSTEDNLIFNRTVSLKDSWAKFNKK
ncbi:MAG: glutamine--tRNA ligase/YqeY domain fusion protein [Melioribacteraceae bacterium]|nr:glutamine--tRNA ligase/YqeY domain fusion protein [Melioribacteraceae bacterium]